MVPEALPTFATLTRLFSAVDSRVLKKLVLVAESLPTLITFISLLSHVDSLVLKFSLKVEAFPTVLALVRSFPSVNLVVLKKRLFADEALPTVTARSPLCMLWCRI